MLRPFIRGSFLCLTGLAFAAGAEPFTGGPEAALAPISINRPATAEELGRLNDALLKMARDLSRWAYTETVVLTDEKGNIKQSKVVRFDPSKPYAEQYTPLEIKGKPPTEKQLQEYRLRGERRGQRLEHADGPAPKQLKSISLSDAVDLSHATIVRDDGRALDFELPLRQLKDSPFPPDKFQVIAHFAKAGGVIENVAVRLRESVRLKLILKVKSGDVSIDFTTVDPKFAPTMTAVHGGASASILFINVGGNVTVTRTDVKRVKPYGDRFDVQIGPTKVLDF